MLDIDVFDTIKGTLLDKKKINTEWLFSQIDLDPSVLEEKAKEIRDGYAKTRDESCRIGSEIHLKKELSFYGNKKFDFSKYGFDEICGEFSCEKNYYKLDLDRGIYPEFMISCDIDGLKISGQVDLLIINDDEV